MLRRIVARVYLMVLALSMFAAGTVAFYPSTTLANTSPTAGGSCCNYSSQCPGTELCYEPSGGLMPCSPDFSGYCKAAAVE